MQLGIVSRLFSERPDAVFIFANPRYLSFWWTLIAGRILRIPVFPHGHGIFKKGMLTWPYRCMQSVLLRLCTRYICYTPSVRDAYVRAGFSPRKLVVAENSQKNAFPVVPSSKTGAERDVLFVGRLRDGSNLEWLFEACERLRQEGKDLRLHVIGTGEKDLEFRDLARGKNWITFHGAIYEDADIANISRDCFVGVYPGNSGLSVVHLMSLSLPPVTHNRLEEHNGPEVSYIRHRDNGWLFDRDRPVESLVEGIREIFENTALRKSLQSNAFACYQNLTVPSLAKRFYDAMFS